MNKVEKIKAEIERRKNQFVSQAESLHKIGKEDKESYYAALASNMNSLSCFLDSLEEEPVSNDLEKAATKYARKQLSNPDYPTYNDEYEMECAFEAGAQWQKKQLEENRIKHCDNITEEQYNLETEFLDDFIDKHDRMPTFLDAIEYGMKLQKEQDQSTIELAEDHAYLAGQEKILAKACEWLSNVSIEDMTYKYNDFDTSEDWYKFIKDFKKVMEE